jgi:UDP-N-acetylglucosamine 2-epimerase (non-hydrolysing)
MASAPTSAPSPPPASQWIHAIACASTSRADAGIYAPLLSALSLEKQWTPLCLAGGTHHAAAFGRTIDAFAPRPGVRLVPVEHLVPGDEPTAVAASAGRAVEAFSRALAEARVDLLFVLGDRTEMLAAALAAVIHRIPIAHLHGGDLTEGAYDDQCRHALTKLAHLHFPALAEHADRIVAMGEEPWRVRPVGALALDALRDFQPPPAARLAGELGLDFSRPLIVVSLHPETLSDVPPERQVDELIAALGRLDVQYLILGPNADIGHDRLRSAWSHFAAARQSAKLVSSMPQRDFWTCLSRAALLVGNSSAGILEAAGFRLPVVNVGDRQKGRRRGANVLDAPFDAPAIAAAIRKALDPAFRAGLADLINPYGDGRTADRIIAALHGLPARSTLLHKKWSGGR